MLLVCPTENGHWNLLLTLWPYPGCYLNDLGVFPITSASVLIRTSSVATYLMSCSIYFQFDSTFKTISMNKWGSWDALCWSCWQWVIMSWWGYWYNLQLHLLKHSFLFLIIFSNFVLNYLTGGWWVIPITQDCAWKKMEHRVWLGNAIRWILF